MPNPSNVKVQLKTVESIEGYSVPAYPITKWECVTVDLPQSRVVSGTTHYIGGIVSSGNSLWFDKSVQGLLTSADAISIGDLRYCPLSNVVSGVTQYANLYVTGATATIIDSNGNTGDGDIPTHEYNIVQAIIAPYGSRNIPSEKAVGEALETKQHILSAGSCIGITAGGIADTIYVSATRTVAPYGQAVHTQLPTEAAVRDALSATSYNLSNYAYALTDALHTAITNSGYATVNWVDSNFIHSGEIVPVDVPYASYGVAGKVQFVSGSGLAVTDDEGTVKLSAAGSNTLGGVMVPAGGGIALNNGAIYTVYDGPFKVTYAGDGLYSATGGNVYDSETAQPLVENTTGYTGAVDPDPSGGVYLHVYKSGTAWYSEITTGLHSTSPEHYYILLAYVNTISSTTAAIIQVQHGDIVLNRAKIGSAPVTSSYASAYNYAETNTFGGVVVMNTIEHTSSYANYPIVPTVEAVYAAISASAGGGGSGGYGGPFVVTSVGGTTAATIVKVAGGYLKWLDGNAWVSDSAGGTSRWTLNRANYNSTTSNWVPQTANTDTELYLVGSSGAKSGRLVTATSYLATISGTEMAAQQVVSHTTSSAGGRYKWQNNNSTYWTDADIPGLDTPFYTTSNGTTAVGSVTAFTYGITVGGSVFSKTADTPLETMGWYDSAGGVEYTNKSWPVANTDYTLYNMASKFGYATSAPSLPPAGAFYTVLAQNQSGAIVQQQYGTVWHEHWGNDYKGQFAIQRIALEDNAATYVPTKNANAYKYIIGNGGNIYGCNAFSPNEVKGGSVVTAGVILGPGAFSYPDQTVGNDTKDDGIYIPYGNTGELWLNIFFGPWPQNSFILPGYSKHQDEIWQFVVTTFKLEGILGNTYSVQLGWVTPNGSPQQEHTGAIAIRGRWT